MKKLIKRNFYNITFIIANAVNSIIVVNNKADWSIPSEYIKARILPIMILPALMGLIFILAERSFWNGCCDVQPKAKRKVIDTV